MGRPRCTLGIEGRTMTSLHLLLKIQLSQFRLFAQMCQQRERVRKSSALKSNSWYAFHVNFILCQPPSLIFPRHFPFRALRKLRRGVGGAFKMYKSFSRFCFLDYIFLILCNLRLNELILTQILIGRERWPGFSLFHLRRGFP